MKLIISKIQKRNKQRKPSLEVYIDNCLLQHSCLSTSFGSVQFDQTVSSSFEHPFASEVFFRNFPLLPLIALSCLLLPRFVMVIGNKF